MASWVEKVRACPATLPPVGRAGAVAESAVVGAVVAVPVAVGGVLAQAASSTSATTAAVRQRGSAKCGDGDVCMKVSWSGRGKGAEGGRRSTDDYFSTILKFATP
ncbi:hypothetical protein D9M69_524310 [compost metagenome]